MNYSYLKNTLKNYRPSEYYTPPYKKQTTNNDILSGLGKLENQYQNISISPLERLSNTVPKQNFTEITQLPSNIPIQTQFSNTTYIPQNHDQFINHVLGCEQCKRLFAKQYNLETARINNEEFMDVVMYVIFGIFVYILLSMMKH